MEKRKLDVVVLSDIHLGTYGCKAKELVAYLRSIQPSILILNGDIIDGWQFSKHYFPPAHLAVIKEVLNLMMNEGTRVFYITGNHDEMLRKYTDLQLGQFTLTDKLVLEINNKMTWIFHGDVFDHTTKNGASIITKLGSTGYASLLLLNKWTNSIMRLLKKEPVSFSKKIMKGFNKAMKIEKFEEMAATIAIQKKYDYVICGHIHEPQKRVISNEQGSVTYLNSGDWVEHLTSLEYKNSEWNIFTYDEKEFTQSFTPVKAHTNVITDEISFYINSLAI
ncbi:MAG: UDP-2,3-diacylglucosamine diphosphatase [Chitinophagaceae bacterium]|nr:UDP-2,3-diacylglucosamine diphosphatase [Chitinophagaceae bacterium]